MKKYVDINDVYPVGSIYMNLNNRSPSSIFGGQWEQIQDCFLLGCGTHTSAGSTGGEMTHTLTITEMPSHAHASSYAKAGATDSTWGFTYTGGGGQLSSSAEFSKSGIANRGGGVAHNNMPPYLSVYIWKRIG